jgi:hypothetical protein
MKSAASTKARAGQNALAFGEERIFELFISKQ